MPNKFLPGDRPLLSTVPDRSWFDPVLDATLNLGSDALEAVESFVTRLSALSTPIAFDIETPGLDRSFTINCVTAAWHWPDGRLQSVLLDPRRNAAHERAARDLLAHARNLIFHNAPFDIPPLYHLPLIGDREVHKVIDTLVLTRLALPDVTVPKNLTALSIRFLGLADDKGGMERAFKAAGFRNQTAGYEGMDIDSPVYRFGAMADTVATLRLEPIMRQKAIERLIDHPFVTYGATTVGEAETLIAEQETVHRVMLRRSAVGLAVDRDYLDRYAEQVDTERNLAIAELAVHGLEGGTGKGAKLMEYLDERGELPAGYPRTPKTGKPSATKDNMATLDHPLANAQRQLAVIEKTLGYLAKVDRQASVTGRCHPQVATLGASATGRMSYGSPELQQFPAEARAIICDDGQGLTSIDWSQIEPLTMGCMARDEKFLAPYEAGEDLYEPIQRACGLPGKAGRKIAKIVLLAAMYGQGIESLARTINHTFESAQQIRRQMFSTMRKCEAWMSMVIDIASIHGTVITAGGRILPVHEDWTFKAVNYVVQGSAYDVLASTIVEMDRRGIADHLQLALHDELVVDSGVAEEVQQIMLTPPEFLIRWAERVPVVRTDRADMGHAWAKV